MKKAKTIMFISTMFMLTLLLVGVVYAWFESNFDPVIYSGQMNISATDGLVIQLTDNSTASSVNVRDIIRDRETDFGLSQVSTTDNETFYKRVPYDTTYEYVVAEEDTDYISVAFMISGENTIYGTEYSAPPRYIYIKDLIMNVIQTVDGVETIVNDDDCVNDVIRFSLTYEYTDDDDVKETHVYVLSKNNYDSNGEMTRIDNFVDINTETTYSASVINRFTDSVTGFKGYTMFNSINATGVESASSFSSRDVLFVDQFIHSSTTKDFYSMEMIPVGKGTKVTLKIWLEGADPRCTLDINGNKVRFDLTFGSYYYDVKFDSNGGSQVKTKIFDSINSAVGTLEVPTKEGYTFVGWYEDINDPATSWSESKVVSSSTTLYAKWQ